MYEYKLLDLPAQITTLFASYLKNKENNTTFNNFLFFFVCDNLQRDIDSSLTYNHGKITNPCKGSFIPFCLFYKMITIFSSSSNYVDRLFLKGTTDYVPKIPDWLPLQCGKAVPDTGAGGKSDRPTSRSINIKHILSILHGCTMLQCQFLRYQAITATSYPIIFKRPQKHVLHLEHGYLSHILVSTTSSSSFMTSTYNL